MGKHKLTGQAKLGRSATSPIKSRVVESTSDDLLRFSFKYYDPGHSEFRCDGCPPQYFRKLLDRIKALSQEKVGTLTGGRSNPTTRFHRIDFAADRVSVGGFGIPGREEYDEDARQFSISANEHGRVHGFLIVKVFYVVWLDPDHKLYGGGP